MSLYFRLLQASLRARAVGRVPAATCFSMMNMVNGALGYVNALFTAARSA
jgi:hypothetical protein